MVRFPGHLDDGSCREVLVHEPDFADAQERAPGVARRTQVVVEKGCIKTPLFSAYFFLEDHILSLLSSPQFNQQLDSLASLLGRHIVSLFTQHQHY